MFAAREFFIDTHTIGILIVLDSVRERDGHSNFAEFGSGVFYHGNRLSQ